MCGVAHADQIESHDECAPAYLALDPDRGYMMALSVVVTQPTGTWAHEYHFPSGARCAEARTMLIETLARMGSTTTVNVGTCH